MTSSRRLHIEGLFRKVIDTQDELWRAYREGEDESEIRADTLSNSLANPFAFDNPVEGLLLKMRPLAKTVDEKSALFSLIGAARIQKLITEESMNVLLKELERP